MKFEKPRKAEQNDLVFKRNPTSIKVLKIPPSFSPCGRFTLTVYIKIFLNFPSSFIVWRDVSGHISK